MPRATGHIQGFQRRARRGGFTLAEIIVAMGITTILLAALGSVVVLASKALPSASGATGATLAASLALEQMSSELRYATSVTEAGATAVTFTVADRNGDGQPETIRYAWAGAGSPLTRKYNAGAAVSVVPSLTSFALSYTKRKFTTTQNSIATWDSGEVQLGGWTTYSTGTLTNVTFTLSTANWLAEAFTIDKVSLPSDITSLAITRVSLKMKKPTTGTIGATVGIYLPSASGASTPATNPIGTPYTVPDTAMTTTMGWVDSTFTDVTFPNNATQSFVIVVKGIAATSAYAQYTMTTTAAADTNVARWTTNTGGAWSPTTSLQLQDAPFAVYGSYQRQVASTVNVDSYTLGSVSISLQASSAGATRIDGAVLVRNEPSVPGP